jgi:hypothetical protein
LAVTDRKKPGVAFWATVVVVALLVAYPLSFGPACWIASRSEDWKIPRFYWPIQTYVPYCPGGAAAIAWYGKLFVPADSRGVLVPFHDRDGQLAWVRYAAAPPRGIPPGGL